MAHESTSFNFQGPLYWGMLAVSFLLLAICALMAGLTLAVSGLDMIWLHMDLNNVDVRYYGSEQERELDKKKAVAIARIKRHGTWMLCSLIITSVACGESLPILVQGLLPTSRPWIPIVVSTLAVLFFAEIIPQALIPKHAKYWAYKFRYLIWGSMFLTAVVSYPMAWLLDHVDGGEEDHIFTNKELAAFIEHHEIAERHGGSLGLDAARLAIVAVDLDKRMLCSDALLHGRRSMKEDVEKCESESHFPGLITVWSKVQSVDIDDPVDEAFVQKIKSWSYSRIPVIGAPKGSEKKQETWAVRVYGFLSSQDLIGLSFSKPEEYQTDIQKAMTVKDLRIYPLPVVHETMQVYDLLNMFQLGMSRLAIVLPAPGFPPHDTQSHLRVKPVVPEHNWTTDLLIAAQTSILDPAYREHTRIGIRLPQPLGIVSFGDIVDHLLKRSRWPGEGSVVAAPSVKDENEKLIPPKSVYPSNAIPPQKPVVSAGQMLSPNSVDPHIANARRFVIPPWDGKLRKRNVSNRAGGLGLYDGVNERSNDASECHGMRLDKLSSRSSNTRNSNRGHSREEEVELDPKAYSFVAAFLNRKFRLSTATLSSQRGSNSEVASTMVPFARTDANPAAKLPPVTKLVTAETSATQELSESPEVSGVQRTASEDVQEQSHLIMPYASTSTSASIFNDSDLRARFKADFVRAAISNVADIIPSHVGEPSFDIDGDAASLGSRYYDAPGAQGNISSIYNAFPLSPSIRTNLNGNSQQERDSVDQSQKTIPERPYCGFPPELLNGVGDKENCIPKYSSKSMPRKLRHESTDIDVSVSQSTRGLPPRDRSFHDDRALLPSQRRILTDRTSNRENGALRSSSFWV